MNLITQLQGNRSIVLIKLLFLLFFTLSTQVGIAQNQKISLSGSNLTFRQAFDQIEKQTQMTIDYEHFSLDHNKKISSTIQSGKLSVIITQLLKETNCVYIIKGSHIIITPKPKDVKGGKVTGVVFDEKGVSIIGASVLVKGTTIGTITDTDGQFSLDMGDNNILKISYIGYEPVDYAVGSQKRITINLKEDTKNLEEVVVIGYGTQKKLNMTGSVTSVTIDQNTASRSVTTVSAGLAGLVPGLEVRQTTGQPGRDGASLRIRGMGTSNNSNPLIVIDGMPDGDINRIDMNDVETVSVLKDAASSAIYGSRAANGVILVTTKKGKPGKLSFNYTGSKAISTATNNYGNTDNYAQNMDLIDVGAQRSGATRYFSQSTIDMWMAGSKINPILYPSTNWWDVLYRNGQINQHNISATSGTDNLSFYGSFGYLDNQGTAMNTWYKRYTSRLNVEAKVSSQMKVGIMMDGQWTDQDSPMDYGLTEEGSAGNGIYQVPAGILPKHPQTGEYGWVMAQGENPQGGNILAAVNSNSNPVRNQQFNGRAYAEYELFKGFKLKADVGLRTVHAFYRSWNRGWSLVNFQNGASDTYAPGLNIMNQYNTNFKTNTVYTANYEKKIGSHAISALAGYTEEYWSDNNFQATGDGRIDEDLAEINATNRIAPTVGGSRNEQALRSFFGRVNYSYKDKYLFEANVRRDESSKFFPGYRVGIFPSFSAGWRVMEEPFMESVKTVISNAKIRASWGMLGNNSGVGLYDQSNVYNSLYYPYGNNKTFGIVPAKYINKELSWESTRLANIGVELAFNKKYTLEMDYYIKTTYDMIRPSDMSTLLSGYSKPYMNIGEMENKGFEMNFSYRDQSGDFKWSSSLNFAVNQNKLLKWNEVLQKGGLYIGLPYNSIYTYQDAGIAQTYDQIYNAPYHNNANIRPGDILYEDLNGDGQINSQDRKIVPGLTSGAIYSYGLNLGLSWKYFDLTTFFQGDAGRKVYWQSTYNNTNIGSRGVSTTAIHTQAWSLEQRDALYPRVVADNFTNNQWSSTFWLQAQDFIRLKNLQLGFNLPARACKAINFQQLRIFGSAENLITITNWKGIDTEKGESRDIYPLLKTFSVGLNITM
jgi:TonB-linked SusC/RagA family outer membrane protein